MLLDDLIGIFSPQAAAERYAARLALRALKKRDYDAADQGRRREGWRARNTSANAEIGKAGHILRSRGNELVRNNPYAKKGKRTYVTHTIGTGGIARPDTGSDRLNRQLTTVFDEWSARCYGPARLNFGGVQGLVAGTRFVAGECLIRFRQVRPSDDWRIPLLLQVMEPDQLDTSRVTAKNPKHYVVQGIEYDETDRPVGYWLYDKHPGEPMLFGRSHTLQSVWVPAEDVLHVYRVDRAGQCRGVTEYDASMGKMRDLDDYENAEIVRLQVAACLAAFIKTTEERPVLGQKSTESERSTA